jgi:hypothetical protein
VVLSSSCTAALAEALAGVLLMLLSGQQAPGALLAPCSSVTSELSSSLQQLQYRSLQHALAQGPALSLLASDGCVSGLSPQLRSRLEQLSRDVLQQVLACWEWGSSRAAREHHDDSSSVGAAAAAAATGSDSDGVAAPATAAGFGPRTCSPGPVLEAKQQQQQRRSLWGSLQWLTGRSAVSWDTPGRSSTQQQQQHGAAESSGLDWRQLLQSLEQAGRSAAACQRLLQHQSQAPPAAYLCPISHELMSDPVVACDGHTYERHSITEWLQVGMAGVAWTRGRLGFVVVLAHAWGFVCAVQKTRGIFIT